MSQVEIDAKLKLFTEKYYRQEGYLSVGLAHGFLALVVLCGVVLTKVHTTSDVFAIGIIGIGCLIGLALHFVNAIFYLSKAAMFEFPREQARREAAEAFICAQQQVKQ